jgi:toxin ParE1/3/4
MGYIVFYSVSDSDVKILRVVSGYRNFQDVFSE